LPTPKGKVAAYLGRQLGGGEGEATPLTKNNNPSPKG